MAFKATGQRLGKNQAAVSEEAKAPPQKIQTGVPNRTILVTDCSEPLPASALVRSCFSSLITSPHLLLPVSPVNFHSLRAAEAALRIKGYPGRGVRGLRAGELFDSPGGS